MIRIRQLAAASLLFPTLARAAAAGAVSGRRVWGWHQVWMDSGYGRPLGRLICMLNAYIPTPHL